MSYAEAQRITGRSRGYLGKQARLGVLTRMGGTPREVFETWLSRAECEQLAMQEYPVCGGSGYWLTMAQAAGLLGMARPAVYAARNAGRLPARQAATGRWLVRRADVLALLATGKARGRQPHRTDITPLVPTAPPPPP